MSNEPPEPSCPPGRRPHADRVKEINDLLPEGKVGGIVIDNTPDHKAWYLHELTKYPRLTVEYQGDLSKDAYLIRVRKGPSNN
jgi:hypothetical protein